jgi:Type ISP C-terminal specificity domain
VEETSVIRKAVDPLGTGAFDPLGCRTVDVHLNGDVFWRNVPERVWDYTLGGYQVLKKWLSYRESAVLGRRLTAAEARTFTQIARRIAAIILLEGDLDANYQRCVAETWDWQAAVQRANQPRLWTDD